MNKLNMVYTIYMTEGEKGDGAILHLGLLLIFNTFVEIKCSVDMTMSNLTSR